MPLTQPQPRPADAVRKCNPDLASVYVIAQDVHIHIDSSKPGSYSSIPSFRPLLGELCFDRGYLTEILHR